MRPSGWLWLAAGCLLAIGLFIGFSPVKSGGYDCGNAFHARDLFGQELSLGSSGVSDCDAARSNRKVVTWVPLIAAVGLGVGAVVSSEQEARRRKGR